jgi:cyanophycinase
MGTYDVPDPRRRLILIGGGEDRRGPCRVLGAFLALAGGAEARLAVIACAAAAQEETGEAYREVFLRLGAAEVRVVSLAERADADGPRLKEVVASASGFFFTGGDQLRLTALLGGTPLLDAVRRRWEEGAVVAGTSAGASAMSATMIVGGHAETTARREILRMSAGFGFLPAVVDQHFAQRGRITRLIAALAQNPEMLGIGLDEDTAFVVEGGLGRVIGSGAATILDARRLGHTNAEEAGLTDPVAVTGVVLHVLPSGYGLRLADRRPVVPDPARPETEAPRPAFLS